MKFLAVLVSDDGTGGGSCIGCDLGRGVSWRLKAIEEGGGAYHDTAIIDTTDDSRTGTGGFGKRHALGVKRLVAVVVGEVEARHDGRDNDRMPD